MEIATDNYTNEDVNCEGISTVSNMTGSTLEDDTKNTKVLKHNI